MTRRIPAAIAVLALALAVVPLTGCGGSDSSSSDTSTSPPADTTATTGGTTTTVTGGTAVTIKDIKFNPESITVKKGTAITWTNKDGFAHNVTAPEAGIKSGDIPAGGTFVFTADKAGTINYVCTIHPGQKGAIIVTA